MKSAAGIFNGNPRSRVEKEITMRWPIIVWIVALLLPPLWVGEARCADEPKSPDVKPKLSMMVWDTGKPAADSLPAASLTGNNDWTAIPADKTVESFAGDAVLSNGHIVAVLRKQDSALEVYAIKPEGAVSRLRLRLQTAAGEPAVRMERIVLTENTKGSVCLEATFTTAKGAELAGKFRIKRGDIYVQAEPGAGAGKLRVEAPGRFVVLPDFFADDIAFDAAKLPLKEVDLPSDNFVLHMLGKSESIAMCVFENRQQDVKVTLAGAGDQRQVTGSEIGFEGKKVWVALLEAPGIWHTREIKGEDAGKIIPLEWSMPFPAQWRVDFPKADEQTDSWEMLLQDKPNGRFTKPSWLGGGGSTLSPNRNRWNTVLGDFSYPCWTEADAKGYLQPLKSKVLKFQGTAILYPINRVNQTPLEAYTVVDVMRNTLGVGPCQHILDLEGQKVEYKGMATCEARDRLTGIYEKKQQKEKSAEADKILDDALTFVKHIRGRITRYVEFGHKMRDYLAEQKKTHPELADFIAEMEQLNAAIDKRAAARKADIRTPDHVAELNAEFRKNVLGYEGADALTRCKKYAAALVEVGDNQDELSGECRYAIKTLRQRAGILMALNPKVAPIATEIRARTQEALRNPANHEGARH
jgi:hypothetical protein